MESLGLRCGKSISLNGVVGEKLISKKPMLQVTRACVRNNIAPPSLVSSSSSSPSPASILNQNKITTDDKLDEWMRDSVSEIVRHIGEAPFLVQLYTHPAKLELEREKVIQDSWPSIKRRWKEGCPTPDGVILVEQLDDGHQEGEEDPTTKAWGVLIQGKGVDAAACYILKTCRVLSSMGFCTHFCLIKAQCFGESAELQLQNTWNNGGISNGFSEL